MGPPATELVLASGSGIRKRLLQDAGFRFEVDPANIDERAIEAHFTDPAKLAVKLAEEKALAVSRRRPIPLVLGTDQVFTLDGQFVAKPENLTDLRQKLASLSGRSHDFHCGFALARGGDIVHSDFDHVRVHFYDLTEAEIDGYVQTREGLGCAGGYRFEEGGVRLIREVEGSHFTVLGLPMIPLITWLRSAKILDSLLQHGDGSL